MAVKNCPFCHLDKEVTRTLKDGQLTSVIMSNPRLMPGHCLIIPKRHVEKPWELTPKEIQAAFEDIFWTEQKLLKEFGTGCDIRQNYRPFIPQGRVKIDHVHFHVLPRTSEDKLYQKSMRLETPLFADLSEAERKRVEKAFQE